MYFVWIKFDFYLLFLYLVFSNNVVRITYAQDSRSWHEVYLFTFSLL
jgi:hypothetical protein